VVSNENSEVNGSSAEKGNQSTGGSSNGDGEGLTKK